MGQYINGEYIEDDDLDDDEFTETSDEPLNGQEPRFFKIPQLSLTGQDLEGLRVDELISAYRQLRDQASVESKAVKERKAKIKMQLSVIGMMLRDKGDELGTDSFATAEGTAFRHKTERITVSDWDALTQYVLETQNFSILQKRVSPNPVKEIREGTGELPPGLESFTEETFSVRAPTASRKRKQA